METVREILEQLDKDKFAIDDFIMESCIEDLQQISEILHIIIIEEGSDF